MSAVGTALAALLAAADRHATPVLLIGAMARQIVFDTPRKLPARATMDWDFAALVPSWEAYALLLTALEANGFIVHRDRGTARHPNGIRFDLLPIDNAPAADGRTRWPGDPGVGLRMVGYREAWVHAARVLVDDVELPVATVAGLTLLKLLAWADRRDPKHLRDVTHFLVHHGGEERVFDEDPAPDWVLVDGDSVPAWLLGVDVRREFPGDLVDIVVDIVEGVLEPDTPTLAAAARAVHRAPSDVQVEQIRRHFVAFLAGLVSG